MRLSKRQLNFLTSLPMDSVSVSMLVRGRTTISSLERRGLAYLSGRVWRITKDGESVLRGAVK